MLVHGRQLNIGQTNAHYSYILNYAVAEKSPMLLISTYWRLDNVNHSVHDELKPSNWLIEPNRRRPSVKMWAKTRTESSNIRNHRRHWSLEIRCQHENDRTTKTENRNWNFNRFWLITRNPPSVACYSRELLLLRVYLGVSQKYFLPIWLSMRLGQSTCACQ